MIETSSSGERAQELTEPRRTRAKRFLAERVLGRGPESKLGDTLKKLDRLIPAQLEDFHPDIGHRYKRNKESTGKEVRRTTAAAFEESFASHRNELLGATNDLFSELSTMQPDRDTVPFAKVDHFLAEYPGNIVSELGYEASPENLKAVLNSGTRLLQECAKTGEDQWAAYTKGIVVDLLGARIPQLVAHEGEGCLSELEEVAARGKVSNLKEYLDFKLNYADGTPELPFTSDELIGASPPPSPFTHEDAGQAWRRESWMGAQERDPEWSDLAHMAAISDQWNSEYGFTISQGEDDKMTLGFIRGLDTSVKNRHELDSRGDKVFFHSHPSEGTMDGILAPLISSGDVNGTLLQDYGGAYLNIVCKNGITLQIDSRPTVDTDPKGWHVESGELKGTMISPGGSAVAQTPGIMKELRDTKAPFTYSISKDGGSDSRKLTFVHIPWRHLNTLGVSLQDVCFGDGLEKVLPEEFSPTQDAPRSLQSAIEKAKELPYVD
jgi:hypothetical protein